MPAGPARDLGWDRSLVGAYGQDDRSCAYASLAAILDVEEPEHIFDVDMHYFLLGAIYDFPQSRQVIPFAGLYLGAATANPIGDQYDSATFFAFAPVGGLKAYFTPTFGVRAQTRLLAPISLESGSIFCRNGDCAVSISAGSVIWQGDVSVGALFHF